jgi:hypothetical protein
LVMSAFLMVSLFADAFNDACPLAHQQFAHTKLNGIQGRYCFSNERIARDRSNHFRC